MTEDKELAALRKERDTWRTQAKYETDVAQAAVEQIKLLEARAEAAEQALKPFSALARWLPTKMPDDEVLYRASTIVITAGDVRRAARAITGEKQ